MKKLFQKPIYLLAACDGKAIPLAEVPDEVFSGGMLGVGYAVEPASGIFYAPAAGRLQSIAESKHAYTLLTENGQDLLLHIGVDTVELKGEGFEPMATVGQVLKAGEPLARVDLELISEKGFPTVTSVILTDPDAIEKIEYSFGAVRGGKDAVMSYQSGKKG